MPATPSRLGLVKGFNERFRGSLASCSICPRRCRVDRISGRVGYCRAGANAKLYSYAPHHGEEPPISGARGSGTIFFSGCNMKCAYCQNYRFSQLDAGKEADTSGLASIMLELQGSGCHNINLVNPTHHLPQIMLALEEAVEGGLKIPIVYNSSGYDLPDTVKALEGIVDIYLPDMRYSDDAMASRYSDAKDYVQVNRDAVSEMRRQVGELSCNPSGVAEKGLIIRLLVMPGGVSGTIETLRFIKERFGAGTHLSIMSQYYPTYKAGDHPEISRPVTPEEYKNVVDEAWRLGLNKGWIQDAPENIDPRFYGTNIKPK